MNNILLGIRNRLFSKWLVAKDFSNKELVFEEYFNTLDSFNITEGDFYNDNPIWFSKDALKLTREGLLIKCFKDKATHTSWQGTRETLWTSGIVTTRDHFEIANGTWVIRAKACDSWPAIWLLKRERNLKGYTRQQITPEVDIMEVMHKKVLHTVHYGYSETVYRRTAKSFTVCRNDNKFHDYAVECLNDGYNFYIDGILTCKYRSKDPEFVSDQVHYLILNNAALKGDDEENYDFIIDSVKVYK